MEKKHYTAIVLAAGSGRRMNSKIPKQFLKLNGYPMLYYSLKAFELSPVDDIILVTGAEDVEYCQKEIVQAYGIKKVKAVVAGGAERYLSVYEGLKASQGADYVLIHDGARPMLDQETILSSMEAVQKEDACVVGTPVKDTIKVVSQEGYVKHTPDRSTLWAVQTPQSFSCSLLMSAYARMETLMKEQKRALSITDDAMLVEQMTGHKVKLIQGKYENIKVTTPGDLRIAEAFLLN